ncbi:MAG: decarboxylating 6-phosphogluconate dehydrogenase [Bacillota bacterium]|nr:decarboxylating 6-phosphogluconate dehydrogenase [Bacillota bacterium]
MDIGLVGLGKMGYNLSLNMTEKGHRVVALSRSKEKAEALRKEGLEGTADVEIFMSALGERKVVWLMVPAGEPVDRMITKLLPYLRKGDIVIDGGNSHYRDSIRRTAELELQMVDYVDAGISGGPEGARRGACMMIGSSLETFSYLRPLLEDICVENGFLRVGENGAGHYVKMVHNGIEYGMMQAIAEGFELMDEGPFKIDYQALAELWNSGSVIRSWLIQLTGRLFSDDPDLKQIKPIIGSSGTGLWTVEEALLRKVPVPVIAQALFARYRSEQENSFSARLVAGLRREFGGHDIEKP